MSTPDWLVDPAAPAVPEDDPDEPFEPPEVLTSDYWRAVDPATREARRAARVALAEARMLRTRWLITARRARRLAAACAALDAPAERAAVPAVKHKGGHPGHRARNDRLLALYEATDATLSKMARCRLTAALFADERAHAAGRNPRREYVMPASTVRSAIDEARRHRDAEA